MISYIKGELVLRDEKNIIVETGGIGYQVFVSPTTLANLPKTGETIKIFTYMNVKEDGISLYGFMKAEEQQMFLKLLGVSGVGPKGALAFLSVLSPQDIVIAILSSDVNTLSKAPGIGKKIAQRIILELKDKCSSDDAITIPNDAEMGGTRDASFEAISALTALGYSQSEAARAIRAIDTDGMNTEEILKAALKKMITF